MLMLKEDGFHFYSFPSLSGEAKSLIVILHGHGSHPDKYIKWAEKAQAENPDADILLLRAPIALKATEERKRARGLPGVDDLYTWFDFEKKPRRQAALLLVRNAFNRLKLVDRLNRLVDRQLRNRKLGDENLAFIGFSMGGALAVQMAVHRRKTCAGVVCHSGVVLPFTRAARKPDVLMIVGDQDEIFFLKKKSGKKPSRLRRAFSKAELRPSIHHHKSVRRLKKSGVTVEEKIFADQGHLITDDSWKEASLFVAKKLKIKK